MKNIEISTMTNHWKKPQNFVLTLAIFALCAYPLLAQSAPSQSSSSHPSNSQSDNSRSDNSQSANSKSASSQSSNSGESDIEKRVHAATNVLDQIMATPDKSIPDKIMDHAQCVIVIPSMIRIAIGFGGKHGKGIATCRTAHGWSGPAPVTLTGGSWGLQLGGEAVDVVMLVMNKKGTDDLLASKFKIGANASAAAGPVGRDAAAASNWKLQSEILTYSRARGVFAGVDLSGAVLEQDKDETRVLYGKMEPFADILQGKVPAPHGTRVFEAAVSKYADQAAERDHNQHGE